MQCCTDCVPSFYFPHITIQHCVSPFLSLAHQDLSKEQAHSQELSAEVQRLSQKLHKAEAELKTTSASLDQSQEKVESLSQSLQKSESLLQLEKRRGSAEADATSNSNSDSSNQTPACQTHTLETSHRDQSPEAGKGRDLSAIHDHAPGESERQLSERLIELEKEVCLVFEYMSGGCVCVRISFTGCLCGSVQFLCVGDDLHYVEILALGMFRSYQLTVGRHFPECSTLFPELLLYLCSSVFIMSPRLLLIFLISSAVALTVSLALKHAHTHIQTHTQTLT